MGRKGTAKRVNEKPGPKTTFHIRTERVGTPTTASTARAFRKRRKNRVFPDAARGRGGSFSEVLAVKKRIRDGSFGVREGDRLYVITITTPSGERKITTIRDTFYPGIEGSGPGEKC